MSQFLLAYPDSPGNTGHLHLSLPVPVTSGLLAWGPLGSAQQETEPSRAEPWGEGVQGLPWRPVWPEWHKGSRGSQPRPGWEGAERAVLECPGRQKPLRKCQGGLDGPWGSRIPHRRHKSEWSSWGGAALPAWTDPPSGGSRAGLGLVVQGWQDAQGQHAWSAVRE